MKQITDHMTRCHFWLHVCIQVDYGFECAGIVEQIVACLVDVSVLGQPTKTFIGEDPVSIQTVCACLLETIFQSK